MHIILLKYPHIQIVFLKFTSCEKSGFSRVYSNCCCSCWFEPEIIIIGESSHKMYSNNILNFQESTTILNACTKKFWKLIEGPTYIFISISISIYIYIQYIHIHISSSSSKPTNSMDSFDSLLPFIPISHHTT